MHSIWLFIGRSLDTVKGEKCSTAVHYRIGLQNLKAYLLSIWWLELMTCGHFFWWAIPIAWLYDIEEGAACNHSSIFFLLQFHNVACGVLFIFSPIRWLYNLWLMRYRNWKIRFFMFCFPDVPSECFIHASYWLFRIHRLDDHGSIRPFCHRLAHFAFPVIDVLFRRRTAAGRRPWGRTVPWPRQVQNPARRRRTVDFSAMGCAHSFATAIRKQCRCQCLCKKKYWN